MLIVCHWATFELCITVSTRAHTHTLDGAEKNLPQPYRKIACISKFHIYIPVSLHHLTRRKMAPQGSKSRSIGLCVAPGKVGYLVPDLDASKLLFFCLVCFCDSLGVLVFRHWQLTEHAVTLLIRCHCKALRASSAVIPYIPLSNGGGGEESPYNCFIPQVPPPQSFVY